MASKGRDLVRIEIVVNNNNNNNIVGEINTINYLGCYIS
jgi:hypothetical protein